MALIAQSGINIIIETTHNSLCICWRRSICAFSGYRHLLQLSNMLKGGHSVFGHCGNLMCVKYQGFIAKLMDKDTHKGNLTHQGYDEIFIINLLVSSMTMFLFFWAAAYRMLSTDLLFC